LPDAAGPSMAITMVRKILQIGFKIYAKYHFLSTEEDGSDILINASAARQLSLQFRQKNAYHTA
jgi:hypothetical protein